MRIALLPLDDRPVNTDMVRDIAAIAGATIELPAVSMMPDYRAAGDAAALRQWLLEEAADGIDAAIVSLDMLGYGGLIQSRISHDSLVEALERISVLKQIRRSRPGIQLGALNVFLRASNADNNSEEPEYWSRFGRALHGLGAAAHSAWLESLGEGSASVVAAEIPTNIRLDFALRRLRNHSVNLAGLELLHAGTVDTLLLTADDTAPRSAGSAEQALIDYWRTLIGPNSNLLVYPGADEVAAAMAARLLSQQHGVQVSFRITCVDPAGLGRVAPFENVPIATTLKRQIQAAGAVSTDAIPDVEIVVHAPSPTGGDFYEAKPDPTPTDLIQQTVAAVAAAFERGVHVAVADCRWPNGSDPALAEALHAAGMLDRLVAYGGWNTAGNTIGSVVAAASAAVIGKRTGSYDGHAQRRFLLTRIVEDYGYQAIARHELNERGFPNDLQKLTGAAGEAQAELVRVRLNEILHEIDANWDVVSIRFPWDRGFEIGLRLEPA